MATNQEIEQYRLLPYDVLMTEGGDPDKLGRGSVISKPLKNSIMDAGCWYTTKNEVYHHGGKTCKHYE